MADICEDCGERCKTFMAKLSQDTPDANDRAHCAAVAGRARRLAWVEVARLRAELDAANNGFRLLGLSPDAASICRQTHQQNCHTCINFACGDNQVVSIRRQSLRERDRLRAENARLLERDRWIPVTERLPEVGQRVLVWRKGIGGAYESEYADFGFRHSREVSHWRAMPAAPEVKRG